MTNEQSIWLRHNPNYRPLSRSPSGFRWGKVGMLHPEGIFELTPPRMRPAVRQGSFEVGVLESIKQSH
jgi:hypothetical protein